MKPDAAQQQPSTASPPPPDAGAPKAAQGTVGSPKRGTVAEGIKKKQRDASEKMTKTASFCLSAEQSHIAAEERDKKKGAPAAKGIVATLLSLNPLAFVARPRMRRVDSLEVIRKRIQVKEEPPSPFPLQTTLGVCLTVFLLLFLVAYLAIGMSAHETTSKRPPTRSRRPGFNPAFNDTYDDMDLPLLDTSTDDDAELEQLSLPLPKKDVNGSGPATDAEIDSEVGSEVDVEVD
ncbi:uncharacterized protein LOC144102216 [Amblyomma americanum]